MPPKLHFAADAATAIRLRRNAALGQACSFEKRAASRALAPLLVASLAPYRITDLGSRQRYACLIARRASPAAKLSCATPTRIECDDTAATQRSSSGSEIGPSSFFAHAARITRLEKRRVVHGFSRWVPIDAPAPP